MAEAAAIIEAAEKLIDEATQSSTERAKLAAMAAKVVPSSLMPKIHLLNWASESSIIGMIKPHIEEHLAPRTALIDSDIQGSSSGVTCKLLDAGFIV